MNLPRRRVEFTAKIGADSIADLIAELSHIQEELALHPNGHDACFGSPSRGGLWCVTVDTEITHDSYFEEVDKALAQ